MAEPKSIAIVGAGIFGLSLAIALRERNYKVTVFERYDYDLSGYVPDDDGHVQAASVDHNKIFRASYGTEIHYQRLAIESGAAWSLEDEKRGAAKDNDSKTPRLFVGCGMLRVQPSELIDPLEAETLASMERDGVRDKQFVKSILEDRQRAHQLGWQTKLIDFKIPQSSTQITYEAVLDSMAGFIRSSSACAHYQAVAAAKGVEFRFGHEMGAVASLEKSTLQTAMERVTGLKTQDGTVHSADVVVIAAGSFSTQILPELSYHLESSAGSLATFKIDRNDSELWDKYSPERFPVITWKQASRDQSGKDTGNIYVLPRTPEGLVKIGFRGIKFTNFERAPGGAPFSQEGQWSVPLPAGKCSKLPEHAAEAIKNFVSIFLPEFDGVPFYSTKLCWYTDSLDNSFVIDYVPTYAENSVFVCTGGSGHGAKFLPVLGKHAADILENRDNSTSYMRKFWRWRPEVARRNGLEEGPGGPRDIAPNKTS